MNMKTKLFILIGALVLFGALALVWGSPKKTGTGPVALAADHPSYDFGTISMAGGKVTHAFRVENLQDRSVELRKISTSCMCTEASFDHNEHHYGPFGMPGHGMMPKMHQMMESHDEATVTVTFDPAAHGPAGIGKVSRRVTVETSTGAPLELEISANVTP